MGIIKKMRSWSVVEIFIKRILEKWVLRKSQKVLAYYVNLNRYKIGDRIKKDGATIALIDKDISLRQVV